MIGGVTENDAGTAELRSRYRQVYVELHGARRDACEGGGMVSARQAQADVDHDLQRLQTLEFELRHQAPDDPGAVQDWPGGWVVRHAVTQRLDGPVPVHRTRQQALDAGVPADELAWAPMIRGSDPDVWILLDEQYWTAEQDVLRDGLPGPATQA